MQNDNDKSEISDDQVKNSLDIKKNYERRVEQSKQFGKESIEKIKDTASSGTEYIKSHPQWKSLKNNSVKIKEKGIDSAISIKKNSPKFYKKISNGFFYFFESIVGRIKLGTQYGTSSLEILEKLAKLKELGILTDEEFAKKKKKILDRI
ncbi:MAG: SHOCT domain-containing protein [Nitrosarchaeum sp.]|nr:SHOCT domain-containing protein [Nitrosarchaeum sp.]